MYLIFMNARTSDVLLANKDSVQRHHEKTRELLSGLYPDRRICSPMEKVPSGTKIYEAVLVTVYKSPNKRGEGRLCGPWETWAVCPVES